MNIAILFTGQNKYPRPRRYPSRNDPLQFDGDFDFESSNAQFNKEDIAKELMNKLKITTGKRLYMSYYKKKQVNDYIMKFHRNLALSASA